MYKLVDGKRIALSASEIAEFEQRGIDHQAKLDLKKSLEYLDKRKAEYGTAEEQLEYIAEFGISMFQSRQQAIKDKYPKGVI